MRTAAGSTAADRGVRILVVLAFAGMVAAMLLIGWLHLAEPDTDPLARTISEYSLGEYGAMFNGAVLTLAGGSAALHVAMIRRGLLRPGGAASVFLLLWSVSLVLVVVFPKHDWSVGPTPSGEVHRVASVVAFLSLPFAALLIGRRWRRSVPGRVSILLGVASLLCLTPLFWAIGLDLTTGFPWWQAIQLGLTERVLVATEVLTLLVMACWTLLPGRTAVPLDGPEGAPQRVGVIR
ncbi:MAG: DUF998 domain-containing protein [Pseudonocardiaceae bacterium]|nr:DUF998 domain-containing protein [Pseudonocardiaceae bacterium]